MLVRVMGALGQYWGDVRMMERTGQDWGVVRKTTLPPATKPFRDEALEEQEAAIPPNHL